MGTEPAPSPPSHVWRGEGGRADLEKYQQKSSSTKQSTQKEQQYQEKNQKMFPPLFPGKGRSAMRGGEEEKAVKRRKDKVKMLQCTL